MHHQKPHQPKIHRLPLALPLLHLNQNLNPPLSSNDTPSPQPSNPFLDDIMDAPPRPSNPLPLQSHHSLDITLSLSPITPLDHILDTPSPPSPQPPPQPPLMGHPIYFNMFDYHEYLFTSVIASSSLSHP
ncbi:hypothetical protein Tco_1317232 [Tanacetum coccineum]